MTVKVNGRIPIPGVQKDIHRQNSQAADQWANAIFASAALIALSPDKVAAAVLAIAGGTLKIISNRQQGLADDPPGPDCYELVDPPWPASGQPIDIVGMDSVPYIGEYWHDLLTSYANGLLGNDAVAIEAYGISARASADRALTCLEQQDLAWNDLQTERAHYFIRQMGVGLSDASYNLWVLQWIFEQIGIDPGLTDAAILTGEMGWNYQQVQ